MNIINEIENQIQNALENLGYQTTKVTVIPSSRRDLGEYQFNDVMKVSKMNNLNPIELAKKLVVKLKETALFDDINIAGPGFINFTISKSFKINYLNRIFKEKNYVTKTNNNKIVIDYGGANVAKTLHVGHLRSANIGEALKRLAICLGSSVISDVHLGDYGLQMGMVLLEIKTRYPDLSCFKENYNGEEITDLSITNEDLIYLYPIASQKAKENEDIMNEARKITYELQNRNNVYVNLWKKIVSVSVAEIKNIYKKLNVSFDLWNGESDSEKYIPEMLKYLEEKNLIIDSEGAKIIDVSQVEDKKEMPPLLLLKSNKAVSYETTDLATIWERMKKYNPDEIWYVVDKRQELHFEQVFRAARKSNIVNNTTNLEFIGFGTMNGKDGKPFKTRDGGVMSLNELLELVKVETEKNMIDGITGLEREKAVEKISIGTLKFADLISNRSTDYIFDPIRFSDANGKTAPFIMYSTVRIKSLLKKAKEQNIEIKKLTNINDDIENNIALNIINLQKVLEKSYKEKSLNEITNYIYELNNSFNLLYSTKRILSESDKIKQENWLVLASMISDINEILFNILAIYIPERM